MIATDLAVALALASGPPPMAASTATVIPAPVTASALTVVPAPDRPDAAEADAKADVDADDAQDGSPPPSGVPESASADGGSPQPGGSGFTQPLAVAHCPYEAPQLPAETETALDATLLVKVPEGVGSAVMISPDGFALTAAHVVGEHERVEIVAHGGAELAAQVVRVHEAQDVALLKVDVSNSSACLSPLTGRAPLGAEVFILGSPAGEALSFSLSKGVVASYRAFSQTHFVQLDASVNPGNSGGPVVDEGGNIVGIASWKISHVAMEGLAFAVPADVALQVLGVVRAPASSHDWASLRGHVRAADEDDKPPPPKASAGKPFNPAQIRRKRLRTGLIVSGAVALGVGVTAVVATGVAAKQRSEIGTTAWKAMVGTNVMGWTLSIAGAAALLAGLVIPKKVKKRKGKRGKRGTPTADVAVDHRGITVRGRF